MLQAVSVRKCISVSSTRYKVFGTGTKLIISESHFCMDKVWLIWTPPNNTSFIPEDQINSKLVETAHFSWYQVLNAHKANTAPKNHEILSSENENKLTYVCLIEKFYPEFIRVTWTEEEKEVTGDVVNGEVWKSADDDEYSVGSWLTVPKENINKKYYCKYEHESKKESLRIPSYHSKTDLTNTAEEQNCDAYFRNSTTFYGDHLMHRTAYLVYTVLLLKSSMYYLIVLFLVYRMRTPAKPYGK